MSLLDLVRAYAGLGDHRTGTDADRATSEWVATQLVDRGARVEPAPFTFDRYVADWQVSVDGTAVESFPLFYAGTGQIRTRDPARLVTTVTPDPTGKSASVVGLGSAGDDRPVVFALAHPLGLLAVPNREPVLGSGFAVQVPAALGPELPDATVEMTIDARLERATAVNIIGTWGDTTRPDTVLVTTPTSGWFTCAGERGTGLAVALETAASLAARRPVIFLAATGHELGFLGAAHLHARFGDHRSVVVHVGANAACATGRRVVRVACPPGAVETVGEIMAAANADVEVGGGWLGEAAAWAEGGSPVLSLIGANPYFHTTSDQVDAVTSAAALAEVGSALTAAVHAMLDAGV